MAHLTNSQAFDLPDLTEFTFNILSSDMAELYASNLDHLAQASRAENRALVDDFANNELDSWTESRDLTYSLAQRDLLGLDSFGLDGNGHDASLNQALTTSYDFPLSPQPNPLLDKLSLDSVPESRIAEWSTLSKDDWAEVPSSTDVPTSYDPSPALQTDNLSLNSVLDSRVAEWSMPLEDNWIGIRSLTATPTSYNLPSKLQTDNLSLDGVSESRIAEWLTPLEVNSTDLPGSSTVPIPPGHTYQPTPDLKDCSTPTSLSTSDGSRDSTIGSIGGFDMEDQRWHAMLSRSRTADRYFLYGVLTTKIFCRPSCASRRPSRRHVRFFSFPGAIETASQAKFRPCKRCKPETGGTGNTAVLAISKILRKVVDETFEERNDGEKGGLKLESLAKSAGLSTFHFHRLFKATTKVTPADFITACHALALQDSLCTYSTRKTTLNPPRVQLSPRWNERTARKALGGLTPEEYANGAESASIEHCRVSSPAGDLEVAYSGNKKASNVNVHAIVLLQDISKPIGDHFGASKRSQDHAQRLQICVKELEEICQDRDVELAADVLSILWRARLWLKLTHDNGSIMSHT